MSQMRFLRTLTLDATFVYIISADSYSWSEMVRGDKLSSLCINCKSRGPFELLCMAPV